MASLYTFVRPLAMMLPPEAAHRLSLMVFKTCYSFPRPLADDPILETRALGMSFKTPIGIAAGYDKNGEIPASLFNAGFGFVEVGTLTPKPQPGNPRPRIFRLRDDRAIINRLGFNNCGFQAGLAHLEKTPPGRRHGPLGVNIGANKDAKDPVADYLAGLETFFAVADYFTVNISSPNTPGLRDLQKKQQLDALLGKLAAARKTLAAKRRLKAPALFVKIAPDLERGALKDIVATALKHKVDGLIISNTTVSRPAGLKSSRQDEPGGLSGQPLFELSTACLEEAYRLAGGKLTLIGVGGIETADQAYQKILKGASLVQLYTGLVYQGPTLPRRLSQGLAERLRHDGFTAISQAVGTAVK